MVMINSLLVYLVISNLNRNIHYRTFVYLGAEFRRQAKNKCIPIIKIQLYVVKGNH